MTEHAFKMILLQFGEIPTGELAKSRYIDQILNDVGLYVLLTGITTKQAVIDYVNSK